MCIIEGEIFDVIEHHLPWTLLQKYFWINEIVGQHSKPIVHFVTQAPNLARMYINILGTFSDIGPLGILSLCPPYWVSKCVLDTLRSLTVGYAVSESYKFHRSPLVLYTKVHTLCGKLVTVVDR